MPRVNGKHFSYDKAGYAAARKEARKKGKTLRADHSGKGGPARPEDMRPTGKGGPPKSLLLKELKKKKISPAKRAAYERIMGN